MKRLYNLIVVLVLCIRTLTGQEFDLTFTNSESGTQTHVARNSVTLGPNYSYTPSGGSLTIEIQNPIITGPVTYTSPINPETRTLNTTSYLVGATNGSFNINPMGGASYSIPLELLPGVNGLTPNLSIVYSNNSGPGTAGYNWQLDGFSAISRGPKTYYNDGTARSVELDTSDRFYLDGQRLVTTNFYPYGNANAEYQTENDIFTRVKQYGTDGYGPGYFKAETKSGLIYEYGNTTTSKQKINGYSQIVNWYVSKISDKFGNQLNFAYFNDRYSVYPYEITYGPNTVTFYYKERSDKNSSYLKGTKIEQLLILDKIIVKYNTTIVKTYELKYNYRGSSYNYSSILNEVIEYGIGSNRLNSTAFTYQVPENVTFTQAINNTSDQSICYTSRLFSGDFNGDGKADIFCLPSGGLWRYYKNNGNNTFTLSDGGDFSVIEGLIQNVIAVDLNGDNKDDILFNTSSLGINKYYYAISNGTTFGSDIYISEISGGGFLALKRNKSSASDLNGDGLNDCVIIKPNGEINIYSYQYYNGQLYTMALRATFNFGVSVETNDKIFLSDFNGDGMADIWKINASGIKIYAVRGSSLVELYTNATPNREHFLNVGDFNGDGKTDLFLYGYQTSDWTNWQIYLSTGTNFETIGIPQKKTNLKNDIVREGDFNGDGCTDLMITASADNGWRGHYYYISKNVGTDYYSHFFSEGEPASCNYYIDDYNGDGREDYLCTDGASPWSYGYMIYNAPGRTNTLLEKVGNGLGYLTKLTYTKLSQASSSIYQRGTGASFPVADYQGPFIIVDSIKFENGLGTINIQKNYYEGAKFHFQGKGLLCFSKIKNTDVTSGIENQTVNNYNTTYYYPQLIQVISKRAGVNDTISKVTNTWSHKVLDPVKKRILPYIQKTVQLDKLTGHSNTTIITDFDNYGNPSPITKTYSGGHTETSTITYNNTVSSSQWLLGRPITTLIQYSGYDTTFSRTVNRTFESTNNNLTTETIYPGTALELIHRYRYNGNGTLMRDSLIVGSVWRTNIYKYQSADGIRVEKVTDPLSQSKEFTYYSNGRLWTEKDYLNNTVTYQYDEFGRQTSRSTTFGDQVTTTFNWESPTGLTRYHILKTGNDGSVAKTYYDELGRVVKSDVKGFDGNFISTTTDYNTKGQVYRVSEPASTTAWNVFAYNNYGQITGITRPSGKNSSWSYNGATITETIGGKGFIKTYSSEGYILTANDNGGSITYSYLPNGKVKNITAPDGIITRMKYDYADNQVRLDDPSAGRITYTYNAFGELTGQTTSRPGQNTTITYLNDGRINQKTSPEGITTYQYTTKKQLKRVKISTGVNRIYRYDAMGRMVSLCDSIGSLKDSTTYAYDPLSRLSTITHPSGIQETRHYNDKGFPEYVNVGSTTLWKVNSMNSRLQISTATYGNNLNLTCLYDDYGYPTASTVVNGSTALQDFEYNFNPITGNLNWRKDRLTGRNNIQENFDYDNLDRLKRVSRSTSAPLNMAYDANRGGITRKSDVGKFYYNINSQYKPYGIISIDSCTIIPGSMNDSLTYTSFEKVKTIKEGIYDASFMYNCNNQRAKMVVQQNSAPLLTRWYMGDSYMKQDSSGVQKEYTFIGGDAYTAPVVAITQGTTKYYYLIRDYLGNITNIVNQSNIKVKEYSYDAWGRMRDPSDWAVYNPGSEPWLFCSRGYTGHEHLPWFKLINMNGRLYDPLTAQFLSADNYVQASYFTQSFNRYGYCLNNPLKYSDPTGLYAIQDYSIGTAGSDGGSSRNSDFRFYEPQSGIGQSSGQAWACRNITPHIAAYKVNQYVFNSEKGYWVNGLGERTERKAGTIYRVYTTSYKDPNLKYSIIFSPENNPIKMDYTGGIITVGHMDVIFSDDPSGDGGNQYVENTNPFKYYQAAFTPIENIGPKGGFIVKGYTSVYQSSSGKWYIKTSASATCPGADAMGVDVAFNGRTDLIVNGQVIQSQYFGIPNEATISDANFSWLGITNMPLPTNGSVQLRMNVSYLMMDPGGNARPQPSLTRTLSIYK